jgi:hypothetical protein
VPVTAKLSRHFYERFGERAANELVDWMNAVDASYQANLRELNELNFARFDAKLEQRLAEFRGEIGGQIQSLRTEMTKEIHALRADVIKWMFLFWTGTTLAGLLLR